MIYNRISPLAIGLIALSIFGIIYILGSSTGPECISIADCRACFSERYVPVDDSFCGNVSDGYVCVKDPAIEKRNAMIDVLQCACNKYPDRYDAEKEKLHKLLLYSTSNSSDIDACNFEEYPVVRWKESYITVPRELLKNSR